MEHKADEIDFIDAVSHAKTQNKTLTAIPTEWKEIHQELSGKFQVPIDATNDKLPASNSTELKLLFTNFLHQNSQGKLIQNDFSIQPDQSRYMLHSSARFLPQFDNTNSTKEDKYKHQAPLLVTFVPTKKDDSTNTLEVKVLDKQHDIQYSPAIEMLISLHNTDIALQFATKK